MALVIQKTMRVKGKCDFPSGVDSAVKFTFNYPDDIATTEVVNIKLLYSINDPEGGALPENKNFIIEVAPVGRKITGEQVPLPPISRTISGTPTPYLQITDYGIGFVSMTDPDLVQFLIKVSRKGTEDTWEYGIGFVAIVIEYNSNIT